LKRAGILLVPAAGSGTRLGSELPKVLTPVAGRPMIDHLLTLYAPVVERFIVVVRPGVEEAVAERGRACGVDVEIAVQEAPTGMLDAILVPLRRVLTASPRWVWITWCDQLAVLPETVAALGDVLSADQPPDLVLLTCRQPRPYIHFERDGENRISHVRQRREGDAMPAIGESDAGVFVLAADAYARELVQYAREAPTGRGTGERNFLPFIPWLSGRRRDAVRTVPCRETVEAVGINTPGELRRVEDCLLRRRALRDNACAP
jgi:bifunctional UDP-N-acetylglucosamine pyrophosphorylase/glucosamine-1-phosphate N-acetyltransferase